MSLPDKGYDVYNEIVIRSLLDTLLEALVLVRALLTERQK